MAVIIVDKNKQRLKQLHELLEQTTFGQDLENFHSVTQAIEWCHDNLCELLLLDQSIAQEQRHSQPFIKLAQHVPILIIKSDYKEDISFSEFPHVGYLEPDADKEILTQSVQNLITRFATLEEPNGLNTSKENRYALALTAANDGVWDWDLNTNQIYYSKRWLEVIGYGEEDNNQQPLIWFSRIHPDDVTLVDTAIDAHLRGATERIACEYRIRHKNGFYRWVLTRGKAVFDAKNNPVRLVGSQTDITDRKKAEQQLAHDALHDPLTGLANRSLLLERLRQNLRHQKRDMSHLVSILYIDLDKFKQINDNLGHEAGDEILRIVAQRLLNCSRENDTVARIGGDEYIMLASGLDKKEDAVALANRIMLEVAKPCMVGNETIQVGLSIGILLVSKQYDDAETAIRDADIALYHAKTNGRHRYEIFDTQMQINKSQHFTLQSTLSGAVDRRELLMHYQPIYNMNTHHIEGFEALMRWRHPESGFIYPLDFIPIAEETGYINEMGAWGLKTACQELANLQKSIPEANNWFMSVNVSGRQLHNNHFQKLAEDCFTKFNLNPKNIWLEITESALMDGADIISPHIFGLKDLGIQLVMDDFGTGFSSLSIIHEYDFNVLKIPRNFVAEIAAKPKNLKLIQLIQLLARESQMLTVIEGIENQEEYDTLKHTTSDYAQGFLFSKPLSSSDLLHYLKNILRDNIDTEANYRRGHIVNK